LDDTKSISPTPRDVPFQSPNLARLSATTALNALFDRLPNLRLERSVECGVVGLAFRSPNRLPVRFG